MPVFGIFNVRTDVDAYAHATAHGRGLYEHRKRVCTESSLGETKSLAAPGNRTRVNIAPGFSARYQLSYSRLLGIIIIIDRFYIALFSAPEQTHCPRMCFYMSE